MGWQGLDPTVFIDDDGQAYLYWGNNVCYWIKLNSDMVSYSGAINNIPLTKTAFGPDYEEAPWVYKRNGLWYMAYSSGLPECIAYATSNSPTGPWNFKSIIMPVITGNGGNHTGIIDYKGSSYFFYFKNGLPGGGDHRRSVCLEKFNYNTDGTIPTIPATSEGPPQIGNLNPFVKTEAETICWESGVETEKCSEGGVDVCNIENGDWIKVKGVDFGSNTTSFEARVASTNNSGNIEIRLDSSTGKLVGTCAVSNTGGLQTWVTKSCNISGATGVHDLYLKFTGGSGSFFNFNWWKFYESGTSIPTPTQITPTSTSSPDETPVITPTASITPITTPGSSYVKFRNSATGLYIDGMDSTSYGSNACQNISSNSEKQQWTIISSGDYVRFKNRATGLYLDGMGRTSNGSICGQWSNSGSDNQQWIQETMGNYVRLKNRATGLYLDGMGSTSNGSNLCQWGNSGSTNQQWQLQ